MQASVRRSRSLRGRVSTIESDLAELKRFVIGEEAKDGYPATKGLAGRLESIESRQDEMLDILRGTNGGR